MSGEHEQHQFVTDLGVGQRLSRLGIGRGDQSMNQRGVHCRIGPAGVENLCGESMQGGAGREGSPARGGRQPMWSAHWPVGAISAVLQGSPQRRPHRLGALVEVQAQH